MSLLHKRLLALQFLLSGALELFLELVVGSPRLHDLLYLILGVFNDFVRPFFLSFKQLDPVVESNYIKFDLLTTLSDLGH